MVQCSSSSALVNVLSFSKKVFTMLGGSAGWSSCTIIRALWIRGVTWVFLQDLVSVALLSIGIGVL